MQRIRTTLAVATTAGLVAATPLTAFAADTPVWNVFDVSGTQIAGTTSPTDAPKLGVGSYVDDIPVNPSARYYRVKRSPGSQLLVSLAARPAEGATTGSDSEAWNYALSTLEGSSCDTASGSRTGSYAFNLTVPAVLGVVAGDSACGSAQDLVLTVKRTAGSQSPAKTQFRIIEIPAVKNLDALPQPETAMPPRLRPPVANDVQDITGGHGFDTATELGSGTFVTKVVPGEMVFFKTHLDYGQRITYAVDGPTSDFTAWPDGYAPMYIRAQAYNPVRSGFANSPVSSYTKSSQADDQVLAMPTVRFRNMFSDSSDIRWGALAGDYYYGVVVGRDGATKTYTQPVPVKFSVRVEGDPSSPEPEFVKGVVPTPGSTASTPASYEDADAPDTRAEAGKGDVDQASGSSSSGSSGGVPGGVWAGLGLAGLALLGGLAYAITRRLTAPRA